MRLRVETKARRIECIGQGQVPELFYSAHVSLNAGEDRLCSICGTRLT